MTTNNILTADQILAAFDVPAYVTLRDDSEGVWVIDASGYGELAFTLPHAQDLLAFCDTPKQIEADNEAHAANFGA